MPSSRPALCLALLLAGLAVGGEIDVSFEGNRLLDADRLGRAVAEDLARYEAGGRVPAAVDDAAFAIGRLYRRRGYREVRVDYAIDRPDRIVFRIDEGRLWVLSGPVEPTLAREVPGFADWWRRKAAYGRSAAGTVFVEDRLLDDLSLARERLIDTGFATPTVDHRFVPAADGAPRLAVEIAIAPGPRTILTGVAFEGPLPADAAVLRQWIGLEPWPAEPVPVAVNRTRKMVVRLRELCRDKGHHDPSVTARIEPGGEADDETRPARLVFAIDPGPLHDIGTIEFAGAERVDPAVLGRVFGVVSGEPYNARRIAEGRRALQALPYVSSASVAESERPGGVDLVDLVVEIGEPAATFAALSLGVGVPDHYLARAELDFNDVLGSGRGVEIEGRLGDRRRWIGVDLVDHYLLGDPDTRLAVGPYFGREEHEAFTVHRLGARFEIRHALTPELTLTGGYHFEFSDLRDLGDGLAGTGESDEFFGGPRLGLAFERLDDRANPTRGLVLGATAMASCKAFGATEDHVVVETRAGFYQPLPAIDGHGIVLFLGLRGAIARPLFGDRHVPIQRRLFSGGPDSVRSFELDRLGPQNDFRTPVGGQLSLTARVEARFQIWEDVWGVLFTDVGTVESRIEDFQERHPGYAVGVGLRYQSVIGPLRLEVAFNPDRKSGNGSEDLVEVLFTLGFSF